MYRGSGDVRNLKLDSRLLSWPYAWVLPTWCCPNALFQSCPHSSTLWLCDQTIYHDLAKWLSYYLYFFSFSFSFLLSWTYYTEGSVGKCHVTSVTQSWSHNRKSQCHITWCHMTGMGKIVHRPYSSCISSVENLTRTLSSSPCQMLIKVQLA